MNVKPSNTIIEWADNFEHLKFKEQRKFHTHRNKAHYYFDKIWQHGLMTREGAYIWLAERLGIEEWKAHFRNMNMERCKEAIFICMQVLNDNRQFDKDFGAEPITPHYKLEE